MSGSPLGYALATILPASAHRPLGRKCSRSLELSTLRLSSPFFGTTVVRWWSAGGGLEEFHDVAGGVLKQDLFAAGPFDDVVAEGGPGVAEAGNLGVNLIDD